MHEKELWVALKAARAGAAVVRENFGVATAAEFKSDANPVTAIDRASEDHILHVIRHHFPNDAVMAEESGGDRSEGQERIWLIDPLDGTVNFLHSIPHVAVSVALWVGEVPTVGVIIDPLRREEFTAERNGGAFSGGNPIRVSTERQLGHAIIATGFPYDRNEHAVAYASNLAGVLARAQGVRRFGSAALDLAWVANGRYDGYWEYGIHPWDTGAGVLIITEAGGRVTNPVGNPYELSDPGIVTSNGFIHDQLLEAVQMSPPSHFY